ncbi:MAG: LysR family transcriptional regulator, partial [Pseudomonadota bacterium]
MKLPSLASLRAFEAAARHLGFSAAGRELNVSHAAVAQQVRGLEAFLGLKLVARAGRGLELTPEGVLLADHLAEGFGKISSGIQQLTEAESARPLHITMTPSFAIGWLMPRLPLFREAHPEVELMVNPTVNVVSLADAGYDLAIRFGRGPWPGLESVPLIST